MPCRAHLRSSRGETLLERSLVDDVLEGKLATLQHHRDALAVALAQLGVGADVHDLELERRPAADALERLRCLVAQGAVGLV